MPKNRRVSAAEKRVELKETGAERPRCSCHGEEMYWRPHTSCVAGGWWACAERRRAISRRWYAANPEKESARNRRWREANPEKVAVRNGRRLIVGRTYLGSCGFNQTEVEMMLSGTSE